MKLTFAAPGLPETGVVAAFVLEDRDLSPSARLLNDRLRGALVRAIEASRFKGKKDQVLSLPAPAEGPYDRIVLIGLGKPAELDALRLQATGGQIYAALAGDGVKAAAVAVDALDGAALSPAEIAAEMAFGARLRAYRFDKYRTKEKDEDKPSLEQLAFHADNQGQAKKLFAPKEAVADGVHFTRDLVSEPANVIYPESLAAEAEELRALGVEVDVLGEREMKKLGMGALLGVGQGTRAGVAARGHAVVGRRQAGGGGEGEEGQAGEAGQARDPRAARLHRQGRDLRHRRHLHQAVRRHGGHEVGHGRRRRR